MGGIGKQLGALKRYHEDFEEEANRSILELREKLEAIEKRVDKLTREVHPPPQPKPGLVQAVEAQSSDSAKKNRKG